MPYPFTHPTLTPGKDSSTYYGVHSHGTLPSSFLIARRSSESIRFDMIIARIAFAVRRGVAFMHDIETSIYLWLALVLTCDRLSRTSILEPAKGKWRDLAPPLGPARQLRMCSTTALHVDSARSASGHGLGWTL